MITGIVCKLLFQFGLHNYIVYTFKFHVISNACYNVYFYKHHLLKKQCFAFIFKLKQKYEEKLILDHMKIMIGFQIIKSIFSRPWKYYTNIRNFSCYGSKISFIVDF